MDKRVSIIMGIYNCATTLSEALNSILGQTFSDWKVIMCDDGSEDDTYKVAKTYCVGEEELDKNIDMDLFSWSKESENVIYTGQTNVVEKDMSAMDVYILPSYLEGFGSGVIESEAMGLPVIVSDIPGHTDAMLKDETGLVVKKADVKSLVEVMDRIYKDGELYQSLASNAHSFAAEHFEQGKLFEHILEDRKKC